ncbi:uncharacterized protein LOC135439613 [Drosophila montana]|uniref:uncharacterized protein LOC135439613 n=1 Tax=Drosophila montana TaxID=40370 RepID=UPI00313D879E
MVAENNASSAVPSANRVTFLKRKVISIYDSLQTLQNALTNSTLSAINECGLSVRLKQIERLQTSFDINQTSLEELDLREDFDELAISMEISVRSEIAKRVSILPCSTFRDQSVLSAQTVRAKAPPAIPALKLPTFTSGYTEWADFYSMFTTVIENHPDLADIEKLQHLRSCLKDSALDANRSLEITNDNYAIALNLLEKRLNNRRLVFQAHILEMLGLKRVAGGSVVALRELSDQFNAHIRALKNMGNTEQIAGCIIVQIILQKLDPSSQAKWEERLEDSTFVNLTPSWEHMATFLEQRCRTMKTVNGKLCP